MQIVSYTTKMYTLPPLSELFVCTFQFCDVLAIKFLIISLRHLQLATASHSWQCLRFKAPLSIYCLLYFEIGNGIVIDMTLPDLDGIYQFTA